MITLTEKDFECLSTGQQVVVDADKGYILTPNVNALLEMADMREAQRSYEANLKVIEASRSMLQRAISVLR